MVRKDFNKLSLVLNTVEAADLLAETWQTFGLEIVKKTLKYLMMTFTCCSTCYFCMLKKNDYYLIGHVLAVQSYLHLANVAHVREMVLVAMDTAWMVIRQDISKHGYWVVVCQDISKYRQLSAKYF